MNNVEGFEKLRNFLIKTLEKHEKLKPVLKNFEMIMGFPTKEQMTLAKPILDSLEKKKFDITELMKHQNVQFGKSKKEIDALQKIEKCLDGMHRCCSPTEQNLSFEEHVDEKHPAPSN